MKKNYQTTTRRAGTSGRTTPKKATADPHRTKYETAVTLPEAVTVAVGELVSELEEGLLAFAVGAGLKVLDVILEEEAIQLAGPRGIHDPDRAAVRHGAEDGLVALGGRQVSIRRPRLRTADRAAEVALPTYAACVSTEVLGRETLTRMMAKLSTRRYGAGLEPVGRTVEAKSRSTSKSAVSRRFVAATETALAELMAADLSSLDLVAFMVDGVHFAGHCCVVALGIDIEGNKHPLALEEGDTENATLVKDLIVGLRERGLDVTRPILAVLDGSKALASAVGAVFDHPVIARCQLPQDQECRVQAARRHGQGRRTRDARRLCQPRRPRCRGGTPCPGQADRAFAPGCGCLPTGRTGRDPHHCPAGCAAHPGAHAALHQRSRVHDRDLPGPLAQREALAGRSDGVALVCGRDVRGEEAVPPSQRSSASQVAADRAQPARPRDRHTLQLLS